MTPQDWMAIKYFKPTDGSNYGDWRLLDRIVLLGADALRADLGEPVLITSGTSGKHAAGSRHYGPTYDALDLMFPRSAVTRIPTILEAVFRIKVDGRVPGGIGAYTSWQLGRQTLGGIHMDFRPVKQSGERACWIRDANEVDHPMTLLNLNRLFGYPPEKNWKIEQHPVIGTDQI